MKLLLTCCLLVVLGSVHAQLNWWLKPIVETENFRFNVNTPDFIIVTPEKDKFGILQRNGKYLFEPGSLKFADYNEGNACFYVVDLNNKRTYFNRQGKKLEGDFDDLNGYQATNLILSIKFNPTNTLNPNLYGLVDTLGIVYKEPKYIQVHHVRQGLYKLTLPDQSIEMYEVEETDGMSPQLRASNFRIQSSKVRDRIIIDQPAKQRGKRVYGFTDMAGDTILRPENYAFTDYHFENQMIMAEDLNTSKHGVLNHNGQVVIPFVYDGFWRKMVVDKYFIAKKDSSVFLLNMDGTSRGQYIADQMFPFKTQPYLRVMKNKKNNIVDLNLKKILPMDMDDIGELESGNVTFLKKDNLRGFYSFETGKYTPPQFPKINTKVWSVSGVTVDNKIALYNVHEGKMVTEPIYTSMHLANGYFIAGIEHQDSILKDGAYVKTKRTESMILDSNGKIIFGPVWNSLSHITENMFVEKIGKDTVVIHDIVKNISTDYLPGKTNAGARFTKLDQNQYCFTDEVFDPAHTIFEEVSDIKEEVWSFRQNGKYGIMHEKKVIAPAQFEAVRESSQGMIKVKQNGKWGVLHNPFYKP